MIEEKAKSVIISSRTLKPMTRQGIWKRKKLELKKKAGDLENPLGKNDGLGISHEAIEKWPIASGLKSNVDLRMMILDTAIQDMKRLLSSKTRCPTGQDLTRYQQVLQFMNLQQIKPMIPGFGNTRELLALQVANSYGKGRKLGGFIQERERNWIRNRYIQAGLQGKTSKVQSMFDDEGTLLACREFIEIAGQSITAQDLANAVADYWNNIPGIGDSADSIETVRQTILTLPTLDEDKEKWSLSHSSAVRWLHRLGYDWKEVRKGLYKDGHERDDVVHYRQNEYLPRLETLKLRLLEWNENGELIRTAAQIWAETGEAPCVLVTHDECTFHSNDGPTHQWVKKDSQPLRKKDCGKSIMLSGFLTPISTLRIPDDFNDDQIQQYGLRRDAMELIECGGDVWWNSEMLSSQLVDYAIPIFELQFPGCQAVFLFDNAPSHHAWPIDGLRAHNMNLGPGGKTPNMRNGWFYDQNGQYIVQETNLPDGRPKGLKIILQERGLWRDGLKQKCKNRAACDITIPGGCCAQTLLSLQPDFQSQGSRLQEIVQQRGHISILYPKFHCELNWIEYFWGSAKWYTRKHCKYTLPDLRKRVPEGIAHAQKFIWKFWRRSKEISDAYRAGIGWGAHKKYKSHRRVGLAGLLNGLEQ